MRIVEEVNSTNFSMILLSQTHSISSRRKGKVDVPSIFIIHYLIQRPFCGEGVGRDQWPMANLVGTNGQISLGIVGFASTSLSGITLSCTIIINLLLCKELYTCPVVLHKV